MTKSRLFGYSDRLSVRPGDLIKFYVDAEGTERVSAQLVRLIHGDQHPSGPGFVEEEIDCDANSTWRVGKQFTQVGSFLKVADPERRLAPAESFTAFAFFCPTRPQAGCRQSLIGRWDNKEASGFSLGISAAGRLEFLIGQGAGVERLETGVPLQANMWYFVAAGLDAKSGRATMYHEGVVNRYNSLLSRVALVDCQGRASATFQSRPRHLAATPFLIGGAQDWQEQRGHFVSQLYCGKVERPGLFDRVLTEGELERIRAGQTPPSNGMVAYWDTAAGYTDQGIGDLVTDVGPHALHAAGYNRPVRGQTGWNWSGRNDCFRLAPNEYGGIEFAPASCLRIEPRFSGQTA